MGHDLKWFIWSGNGLSHVRCQAVINLNPKEYISWKSYLKFISFHWNKCIWKCRLQTGSHFNSVSGSQIFFYKSFPSSKRFYFKSILSFSSQIFGLGFLALGIWMEVDKYVISYFIILQRSVTDEVLVAAPPIMSVIGLFLVGMGILGLFALSRRSRVLLAVVSTGTYNVSSFSLRHEICLDILNNFRYFAPCKIQGILSKLAVVSANRVSLDMI